MYCNLVLLTSPVSKYIAERNSTEGGHRCGDIREPLSAIIFSASRITAVVVIIGYGPVAVHTGLPRGAYA